MSPRLLLACATLILAAVARGEESCCEKPVSRTSMLTGGKGAAPAPTAPERRLWPILSLSLGGAAAAVGALYVRRRK